MQPKIAVVVAWGGSSPGLLRLALRSIELQTSRPAEVHLVIDNVNAQYEYQMSLPLIIHRTRGGVGPALARNLALDNIADDIDYIAIMDADDFSHPERLHVLSEELNSRSLDAIGSQAVLIDGGRIWLHPKRATRPDSVAKSLKLGKMPFIHSSMLFRAEIVKLGFRYPETQLRGEDLLFIRDLAAAGMRLGNSSRYLFAYRHKLVRGFEQYRRDIEIQSSANLTSLLGRYTLHLALRLGSAALKPTMRRQWKRLLNNETARTVSP